MVRLFCGCNIRITTLSFGYVNLCPKHDKSIPNLEFMLSLGRLKIRSPLPGPGSELASASREAEHYGSLVKICDLCNSRSRMLRAGVVGGVRMMLCARCISGL